MNIQFMKRQFLLHVTMLGNMWYSFIDFMN